MRDRAAGPLLTRAWVALLLGCMVALLLLAPILLHPGWPANHEYTAPVLRMGAVLEQWRLGHAIPLWSARQQFGMGSPMPALYHKSFVYLSTAVLWATGSAKAAILFATGICMVGGFSGMWHCLRTVLGGRHPALWLVGGAVLMAGNYASTDWLVRGAFAEFAAFAILPWVFGWCFMLIRTGRWAWWIGPVLALLALSHSTLGLFAAIPLGLALAIGLWRWRCAAWTWWRPAVGSLVLGASLIAPFALPIVAMARFNRIGELTANPGFNPVISHTPWWRFFWDADWHWGATWQTMTVQVDTGLLLLLPLFILAAAWTAVVKGRGAGQADVPAQRGELPYLPVVNGIDALFLLGTLLFMAWLQGPQASTFYAHVPGAIYLQFSWRLLAYISVAATVCAVLALAWVADRASRHGPALAALLAVALLVSTCNSKPWWGGLHYEWIAPATLQGALEEDYVAGGEFLPLVDWPRPANLPGIVDQIRNFLKANPQPPGCVLTDLDANAIHSTGARWRAVCERPSGAALPAFAAPGMQLSVNGKRRPLLRSCRDPRLQVALPAGTSEVQLDFPTWLRTVKAIVVRQDFDYRRDCGSPGS